MLLVAITVSLLVVLGLISAVLTLWTSVDRLKNDLAYEKASRREEYDRLSGWHWDLQSELWSGFGALGMKRQPEQPAKGPSWTK